MWIALSNGWLSIVSHREQSEMLLVRARKHAHTRCYFPKAEIYTFADADYPFRADIMRTEVGEMISNYATEIQYDNFKDSVDEYDLANSLGNVWHVMYEYGIPYRRNISSDKLLDGELQKHEKN
jgi:hypothetical protein